MIMSAGICPGGVRYINTSPAVNASPAPERCLFKYSGAGEMCINTSPARKDVYRPKYFFSAGEVFVLILRLSCAGEVYINASPTSFDAG